METFNLTEMMKHLDFNMSAGTVVVGLALTYLAFCGVRWGYNKVTETVSGIFSGIASWAGPSVVYVVAAALATGGFTSIGMGVGELSSGNRPEDKVTVAPLTNDQLVKLATSKEVNKETLDVLVKYTEKRDADAAKALDKAKEHHQAQFVSTQIQTPTVDSDTPNRRTGWMEVFGGLGALITSIGIGIYRFATWNGQMRDDRYA